jgi:2-polyprenyl-6-hydroxyphenyl methylase/3-demethylubiquinone-9 3-methyltransferase
MIEHTDHTTSELMQPTLPVPLSERQRWICRRVVGDEIIDAGCGRGQVAATLAAEGRRVLATDTDKEAVEATQALFDQLEIRPGLAAVMKVSASDLPTDAASVDTVVLAELLPALPDPAPVLREAARVLRPGGRLIVTCAYGSRHTADGHRQVLLGELIELVGQYFTLRDAVLIGGSMGIIAERAIPPDLPEDGLMRALAAAERRLTDVEEELAVARRDAAASEAEREQELRRVTADSSAQIAALEARLATTVDEARAQRE